MGATVAVSAATVSPGAGLEKLGSAYLYEGPNGSGGSRMAHIDRDLKPSGKPFLANGTNHWTTLRAARICTQYTSNASPHTRASHRHIALHSRRYP